MTSKLNICRSSKKDIITYSLYFLVLYYKIERNNCMVITFYFCKYLLGNLSFNGSFVYQISCLGFLLQELKFYDSSISRHFNFA